MAPPTRNAKLILSGLLSQHILHLFAAKIVTASCLSLPHAFNQYNFARCSYGCETWPSTLREVHRFWGLQNGPLMKLCGPKSGKVRGDWKNHDEPFCDIHCSPHVIRAMNSRRIRRTGHVARMGKNRNKQIFCWGNIKQRVTWKTWA
jgi:hypothetical protein